jgi:hypothetical protein
MLKQWIYLAALTFLAAGCFVGVRGEGPRAYVNGAYYYDYYPEEEVYYSGDRHMYYYNSGGTWVTSATLPGTVIIGSSPVRIQERSEQPYSMHGDHLKRYPPGQLKKRLQGR